MLNAWELIKRIDTGVVSRRFRRRSPRLVCFETRVNINLRARTYERIKATNLDVPRKSRILFCPKVAISFLSFNYNSNNKFVRTIRIYSTDKNFLTNSQFVEIIDQRSFLSSRRTRRIIVYGSVTRYGPQSSCQRKWFTSCHARREHFLPKIAIVSQF